MPKPLAEDSSQFADKIQDESLRGFALSTESDTAQRVLIELQLPFRSTKKSALTGKTKLLPQVPSGDLLDELKQQIASVGAEVVTQLTAAQAIAADVTPEQLRSIAGFPTVAAVRPSRIHRRHV